MEYTSDEDLKSYEDLAEDNKCSICNGSIGRIITCVGEKKLCRECADKFNKESKIEKGFMDMLESIK